MSHQEYLEKSFIIVMPCLIFCVCVCVAQQHTGKQSNYLLSFYFHNIDLLGIC